MTQGSASTARLGVEPLAVKPALPDAEARGRLRKRRGLKDATSRYVVGIGGVSVIVALGLIFVYLFSEVAPMLRPASVERVASYVAPGGDTSPTQVVSMDRYREAAFRLAQDGSYSFFRPATGRIMGEGRIATPEGVEITSRATAEARTRLAALGLSDGTALLVKDAYSLTYPDGIREVVPGLEFPFGEEPVVVDDQGQALTHIGVQQGSRGVTVVAATEDGRLLLVSYAASRNIMTGQVQVQRSATTIGVPEHGVSQFLISADMRDLLVADDGGNLYYYDIGNLQNIRLVDSRRVMVGGAEVTALQYLLGTVSILVGGSDGSVSQWFLVRDEQNQRRLTFVRSFDSHAAPVVTIAAEHARKGFLTADEAGAVKLHYSTSNRTLASANVSDAPIVFAAMAPRADGMFLLDARNTIHYYDVRNEHPEVSLSSLWGKVWYEGRSEPAYVWQSSSATDEFEPKLSLVPLTLGTIKAAFYAMLFAVPLAVLGAIYSAYFMTPRMRGVTKPTIEIMEALPTVILGFLAGLWFAPFVETHLPAVFSILILLPVGIMLTGLAWSRLPIDLRERIPSGWEVAIVAPVIVALVWACVAISPIVEIWLFNGDMRQWLTDQGITYDQRNALVVGVAMGFAVIPTIFSIAEDAIFNVPKHLTQGSLALGATPWQTMTRVVLLTASPGIFSAIMIGMGRAVGETMIVLMATGNSPVVNFNIFEGMRTLSANIAVEMPEAEVGGSHFRILFLAALVLFVMTFVLNTAAEIVRQRLRKKYASI
ncbi:MAG: ABC transporter permease subunit [Alphaproteobacteria bacterium]